jgi:hypothetical protein
MPGNFFLCTALNRFRRGVKECTSIIYFPSNSSLALLLFYYTSALEANCLTASSLISIFYLFIKKAAKTIYILSFQHIFIATN